MNKGGAHAGVVMATEHVGVAVTNGTLAALVHLVVAGAVGAEGGGVMEDVRHAVKRTTFLGGPQRTASAAMMLTNTHIMLTTTAQPEVISITWPMIS